MDLAWPPAWRLAPVPERLPDPVASTGVVTATADRVLCRIPSVGRFMARARGPIDVRPERRATDADVRCFLGVAGTARWLLGGVPTLRGAAVALNGAGVVICGPAAGGTSALTAALALRGHGVLADRVALVTGDPPLLRRTDDEVQLWPDMADALDIPSTVGRVVRPALAKRAYRLGPEPSAVPLRAVVLLPGTEPGPVRLTTVDGAEERSAELHGREWHRRLVAPLLGKPARHTWAASVAGAARVLRFSGRLHDLHPTALAAKVEEAFP
ncbi:hypothetical protein Val02_86410 [Virgisporangium aliadipatigenens]|uniref:Serine kinase n=1 Tax=Virgisporangium aliadipatigenens TaxID=741659 RepID=A0A8J3YXY7_9ACTN|nr:hypothetical protein [Virgisporangium aliadipatigenens]GIJ51755.1 hypothetical protein Val02_86410 [Virgisporangium aliadipatigenens]